MPLYEYECRNCHGRSELLVSASRPPVCPHCGSKRLEKQLSTFATRGGGNAGGHTHKHSAACGCCHHGGGCEGKRRSHACAAC
ncbi:MAG: zinc ribbon domain-containing protein [Puniceicoccales bacterium]|jgi:putative FmdB family regulatory protein|nr:zinc ribbon domain-containing protein [Puniceicoccales bacterium]